MRTCLLFAAVLLTLLSISLAYSFDIAIYYDPLSHWNQKYLDGHRWGYYSGSREEFLATYLTANQMESVYQWYREMGVTKVMVNYLDSTDFDWLPFDSTAGIKVMNWNYPGPNA